MHKRVTLETSRALHQSADCSPLKTTLPREMPHAPKPIRTAVDGERSSGISPLRRFCLKHLVNLRILTLTQMVLSKHGYGNCVNSASQPPLQWKMALLDLCRHLLSQCGTLYNLPLYLDSTLHSVPCYLESDDPTSNTISVSRHFSYGICNYRQHGSLCLCACMGLQSYPIGK